MKKNNKKIIAFNWKMNPTDYKEAERLVGVVLKEKINFKKNEIVLIPPVIYLNNVKNKKIKNVKLGLQNIFYENSGAYTGEISPEMAKNMGAEYAIIGHSERRVMGENDEVINKKIKSALENKLKIILCVGEPLEIRAKGINNVKKFIEAQLEKDLKNLKNILDSKLLTLNPIIIAYEPIWAIGTGKFATPSDALEIINFIKNIIEKDYNFETRVLYGGSVNAKNIGDFINCDEIDGVLIGGASVDKNELTKILKAI